mmetsp:Transcript_10017/g.14969  ORF Transcript_10017/g.14969 Transcript_10017/m.14969 type:complete len:278 (-) Transcript_10017:397-1230(-)
MGIFLLKNKFFWLKFFSEETLNTFRPSIAFSTEGLFSSEQTFFSSVSLSSVKSEPSRGFSLKTKYCGLCEGLKKISVGPLTSKGKLCSVLNLEVLKNTWSSSMSWSVPKLASSKSRENVWCLGLSSWSFKLHCSRMLISSSNLSIFERLCQYFFDFSSTSFLISFTLDLVSKFSLFNSSTWFLSELFCSTNLLCSASSFFTWFLSELLVPSDCLSDSSSFSSWVSRSLFSLESCLSAEECWSLSCWSWELCCWVKSAFSSERALSLLSSFCSWWFSV